MLIRRTFQHLSGIGPSKEAQLWADGIIDWSKLIRQTPRQLELYQSGGFDLEAQIHESRLALSKSDAAYFAARLPKREYYRVAESFPDKCLFLDIETTGLSSYYDSVTLVGWSLGDRYSVLVNPADLETLKRDLALQPLLITFNGSIFDLPFLSKKFSIDWTLNYHLDLRFLAKRNSLVGGQKKIEKEIGIKRDRTLEDIDGAQAVSLWFDYKDGDLLALEKLIRYNHADIEGMKRILEGILQRMEDSSTDRKRRRRLFPRSHVQFAGEGHDGTNATCIRLERFSGPVGPKLTFKHLLKSEARLARETIVGIDLTGSEKRKSGWARVCGAELETCLIATDEDLVAKTVAARPYLVSIDSPLSLPKGRITEFDDDPERDAYGIMRLAERQLRKRGINVYPALLPSMQKLTRRGVQLAKRLREMGIPTIESYPGAAQDILGIPRKKTSLDHLLRGLRSFGYRDLQAESAQTSHDELDAATSALVGQFMLGGFWEALGSVEEDFLVVPTIERRSKKQEPQIVIGLSGPIAAGKTTAASILRDSGYQYCRFSEILESELLSEGKRVSRHALQKLGAELHDSRFGQRRLQLRLADKVAGATKIVVDGLRHPEDHAFLFERWGFSAFHLHIDSDTSLRENRYVRRASASAAEFERADAHQVEGSVATLRKLANRIFRNDGSIRKLEGALRDVENEVCR